MNPQVRNMNSIESQTHAIHIAKDMPNDLSQEEGRRTASAFPEIAPSTWLLSPKEAGGQSCKRVQAFTTAQSCAWHHVTENVAQQQVSHNQNPVLKLSIPRTMLQEFRRRISAAIYGKGDVPNLHQSPGFEQVGAVQRSKTKGTNFFCSLF